MSNRELSVEIADFASDLCEGCVGTVGAPCVYDERHQKCLKGRHALSTYRGRMYTVRNDYPITDWRRYIFEPEPVSPFVAEQLRKNA